MHQFELAWFPGTCGRVTLIALEEIGVEVTDRIIPRGWSRNPDYLAINPKGRLPTLIVDGQPFTETPAILSLLSELYPDSRLLPTGNPQAHANALSTMCWFASGIHPMIGRARFPYIANDDRATFQRTTEVALDGLRASFAILEQRLADREWLFDEWSVVDGYLLWLWFRVAKMGFPNEDFPRCAEHAQRCEQRPSVARALDREEAAYVALQTSGALPEWEPPGQVGRVLGTF